MQKLKFPSIMLRAGKVQNYRSKLKKIQISKLILFAFFIVVLHFTFYIFNLSAARAQSLSLSISPPILEVMIKPGKSITQVFKISNEGETVIATPRLVELTETGIKEDPKFTAEKWITLTNTDLSFDRPFLFEEKTQRQLIVKINPPQNTPEQNYYRALLLSTKPNPAGESSQSLLSQNIGAPLLIFVTSTGLTPKEGLISKFEAPGILDSFDPLIVDIDIKNIGKTYFRPVGKIYLSGPIGRGTFGVEPRIILNGQTRQIITEYMSSPENPARTLVLPGFYLGKYELEADFTLDGGSVRLNSKKVFYALPWKAGAIVVGLIVVITLIRPLRKAKKKERK